MGPEASPESQRRGFTSGKLRAMNVPRPCSVLRNPSADSSR
jgi:hypothetical protein